MSAIDELMALLDGGGAPTDTAALATGVPPMLAAAPQPTPSLPLPRTDVAPAPGKHGIDWQKLIDLAIPLTGAFMGNPGQRTGFMTGYARGTEMARQHKAEQDQIKQRQAQAGADFLLKIGEHAQGFDDPVALDQFLSVADEAGTKAGFNQPGQIRGRFTVAPSKVAQKRLVEISGQLDQLEHNGYDLDQLASSGSHIQLSDGTSVPLSSALQITRRRPMDATGAPITKPPKAASTEEERFIAKRAKDYGYKSLDDVDADTQLQWRQEFRDAGRADKTTPVGGVDAQFNDLVELWKKGHPGQEPPADVRTKLRKQANEVNDRPQSFGGMDSLYRDVDPKAIAAQIRTGEHPPDISQYGRPVAAAVASELAKPGPNGEKPFNLAAAQREWRAQLNLNRTMNGAQQVRLDESIRSGLAMYDRIDALAEQWNGKGWGPLSRANLDLARQGAKGPVAQSLANQLTGQIGQLTSDVATIEQGGLTPTNEARAVAEKSLQDWWGKGTIKAMTEQGRYNMQIRHLARNTQDVMVPGNGVNTAPAVPATPGPTLRFNPATGKVEAVKP